MSELEDRMELNEETGSPPKVKNRKKTEKKGKEGGANETRLGEWDTPERDTRWGKGN